MSASAQIQVGFKKVYLLIYDVDEGNREDCNIFYSPIELFDDPVTRGERIRLLQQTNPEIGFRTEDLEVNRSYSFPISDRYTNNEDEDIGKYEDEDVEDDEDDDQASSEPVEPDDPNKLKPNQVLYHTQLGPDHFGRTGFIPQVFLYPKDKFQETKSFSDDEFELSVTLDRRFVEIHTNVYQFNGTLREADSYLYGYGFVQDEDFSQVVEDFDLGPTNNLS